MKLRILTWILVLLASTFAIATPVARSYPPSNFHFDPSPAAANVGSTVDIRIRLDEVTDLNAWQVKIRWNTKVLAYNNLDWGWLSEDVADFNLDGAVDSTDLGILGLAWGSFSGGPNWNPACDLMPDGVIDSSDLGILGAHWGHFSDQTVRLYNLSIIGNELEIFECFSNDLFVTGGTDFLLVTVTFDVIAGGTSNLEFLDYEQLWTVFRIPMASTSTDGSVFTLQPFVDFTMTPANAATYHYTGARTGETITLDGSASHSVDGDTITGYSWAVNGVPSGTSVTSTTSFATYAVAPNNVALTVTDSGGHSYALTKPYTVNRDLSILSIWPSMEDYQGSIQYEFVSGKYVVIQVRTANLGTITEYTNNVFGDFPSTARINLYLVANRGLPTQTITKIRATTSAAAIRRYWNYTKNAAALTRLYDWQPNVGSNCTFWWDLWGEAPATNLWLQARISDTSDGPNPFAGDTDLTNDDQWFGPFNIIAGYPHDIRIEAIYEYDDCGYYLPIPPYGTNYKYAYGEKFLNLMGVMGPFDPIQPGMKFNVTVDMSNVGINDEIVSWYVFTGVPLSDIPIYGSTDTLDIATGYFSFEFQWDTTGYYGPYTLSVYVVPVGQEDDPAGFPWATWDNNTPENYNTYGKMYFNAYDDWVIQNAYP